MREKKRIALSAKKAWRNIKEVVYDFVELTVDEDSHTVVFDIVDLFIVSLIVLNVLAVILETVRSLAGEYSSWFRSFEIFSVVIFSVEYFLRLWSCTTDKRYRHPISGRIRFALTPHAVIDLIAILPAYIPMFLPIDLRFIRVLRLFRMLRFLKLGRYSGALKTFGNVLNSKKEEVAIAVFVVLVLLIFSSSVMYYVEHEAQPDAFSSIPDAMWWAVVTLTTVGYGDIYPVTALGKMLASVIALLGIGLFALPAGIFAAGFAEEFRKTREKSTCPHCGKEIER